MSLILCACGCGGVTTIYKGKSRRYINGHSRKGKHPSKETKQKISESRMGKFCGKNHPLWGKHHSEETKQLMFNVKKGKYCGKNNPRWRGGKKLRVARIHASRRKLGHIFLNDCEVDGWVGHHIDWDYIIFCPLEVHLSVKHSVTKDRKMNEINTKVYDWFVEYYMGR